jgi:hypothetical protein
MKKDWKEERRDLTETTVAAATPTLTGEENGARAATSALTGEENGARTDSDGG